MAHFAIDGHDGELGHDLSAPARAARLRFAAWGFVLLIAMALAAYVGAQYLAELG